MKRRRAVVFVAVLLLSLGCDQATKQLALERLDGAPPVSLAGDVVRLQLTANPGGFLSLGAGLSPPVQQLVFVVLVPACLVLVCALALRSRGVSRWGMAGLGLVVGGGLGNWIDRVREAAVTDFVSLGVGSLRTGIFNVADVAILAGVVLLALASGGSEDSEG
jgi:signal peptidase II